MRFVMILTQGNLFQFELNNPVDNPWFMQCIKNVQKNTDVQRNFKVRDWIEINTVEPKEMKQETHLNTVVPA